MKANASSKGDAEQQLMELGERKDGAEPLAQWPCAV